MPLHQQATQSIVIKKALVVLILSVSAACNAPAPQPQAFNSQKKNENLPPTNNIKFDTANKTIHVLVALCDNKYQGIVPVPPKIGNGRDPDNNLYWGCAFGIRSYFKNSKSWTFICRVYIDSIKMERIIFKNKNTDYYLVADAYDGRFIKKCTVDFFKSCAGQINDTINLKSTSIGIYGNAKLVAYIGHDGLMDFNLTESFANTDNKIRNAIILACISKKYFSPHLAATKAYPLVWSTGLMSPEAYTLHDALESYIKNESAEQVRRHAAKAYARYQKCSEKAAARLLVTGY